MSKISNLLKNPLIIPIAEVIAKAISFINILLLIRILSIDEYADYSYMISIILWASVLMDSGINDLVYNKSLLKDSSNFNRLYSSKIYLSLIIIIFLFLYFSLYEPELSSSAIILSFVILFSSLSSFLKMYSRGNGIVSVDITTIITEPLIRFLLLITIYLLSSTISLTSWQFFLVYLLAGILAFSYNYLQLLPYYRFNLEIESFKKVSKNILQTLSKTKYFFLYYLMFIGLQRIDIILIEKYSTKEDLAIFSTAITLFQVAHLFFYSLLTSKYLTFYKNKKVLYRFLLPGLLSIVILSQVLSIFIYKYLFPVEYSYGYHTFNIIIISLIPSVFSLYFILKNNYKSKTKINFYILLFIFLVKFIVYQYLKPEEIDIYAKIYVIIEILLVIIFMIQNQFNENTPDK